MKFLAALMLASLSMAFMLSGTDAAGEKKVTIGDVMKTAMKGGLCKKCAAGTASDAEKKQLVELFVVLNMSTPPKGDADSWKAKTDALVAAAKKVAAGDADGSKALGAAANCTACHKVHKK
jgi:hypothetical protein